MYVLGVPLARLKYKHGSHNFSQMTHEPFVDSRLHSLPVRGSATNKNCCKSETLHPKPETLNPCPGGILRPEGLGFRVEAPDTKPTALWNLLSLFRIFITTLNWKVLVNPEPKLNPRP